MTAPTQESIDLLSRRMDSLQALHAQTRGIMEKAHDELQARINALSTTDSDLRRDLNSVVSTVQGKLDALKLEASSKVSTDRCLIDREGLGKPTTFNSKNPSEWVHWAFKFRNYITSSGFPHGRNTC